MHESASKVTGGLTHRPMVDKLPMMYRTLGLDYDERCIYQTRRHDASARRQDASARRLEDRMQVLACILSSIYQTRRQDASDRRQDASARLEDRMQVLARDR